MSEYNIELKINSWCNFFGNSYIGNCVFCEIKPKIKLDKNMRDLVLGQNFKDRLKTRNIPQVKFVRYKINEQIVIIPVCPDCFHSSCNYNGIINDIPVPMDIR